MTKIDERVRDVRCTADTLIVDLADGRQVTAPLAWYPRLDSATAVQRENWEPCGAGFGIHWPDVDEHLSTEGLLRQAPAPRALSKVSSKPRVPGNSSRPKGARVGSLGCQPQVRESQKNQEPRRGDGTPG